MLGALRFLPRDDVAGTREGDDKGESQKSSKKRKHGRKEYKERKSDKGRSKHKYHEDEQEENEYSSDESSKGSDGHKSRKADRGVQESKRKQAGLEWMNLAPERPPAPVVKLQEDPRLLEAEKPVSKVKELNPYWKNDGKGMPEGDRGGLRGGGSGGLPKPPGVGDGGASWRMKALKRAQEQAEREGRKLDEVVEERWGSVETLLNSVAVQRAAHANAHLHARRDRRDRDSKLMENKVVDVPEGTGKGETAGEHEDDDDKRMRSSSRDYLKDVKAKDNRMRAPQTDRTLSWRSKGRGSIRPEDAAVLRAAASTYNKFNDDGNFLKSVGTPNPHEEMETVRQVSTVLKTTTRVETVRTKKEAVIGVDNSVSGSQSATTTKSVMKVEAHSVHKDTASRRIKSALDVDSKPESRSVGVKSSVEPPSRLELTGERKSEGSGVQLENLSSNQIAAKVMQLRLRGKHKEADELQKQSEAASKEGKEQPSDDERRDSVPGPSGPLQILSRLEALGKKTLEYRRESADRSLAGAISSNKMYKADDEYDDLGPLAEKKKKKNAHGGKEQRPKVGGYNRIQTQQERCRLCFDNADRPKHLTMAIANFTYLTLPPRRPLVNGHCYIVPMHHEGSTRNVDEGTWEELRNFKKCLVLMFNEQDKEAIFLETAMHLSQQKRHCVVECIPIPASFAKEAPLYFKKAIDEAESEWSQHNAKKLIDTRIKGLRSSVPKNFPYFHVEFGMNGGYAHVIDDESQFKPEFGRDVLQGMLQMEEEEVHMQALSRRDQEKVAKDFAKMWEPHDWTKMLE